MAPLATLREISRRAVVVLIAALSAVVLVGVQPADAATAPRFVDGFERLARTGAWRDGVVRGEWRAVFHGAGTQVQAGGVLRVAPPAATEPSSTHAALVVSTRSFTGLDLTAELRAVRQLRVGSDPNPWETAWLLWDYSDQHHFYYLILKPNGWELGKADPAYPGGQRFLATGDSPSFPIGSWNQARIQQDGGRMTVRVNGALLTTFVDTERPYAAGALGLYAEDAEAQFRAISVAAR